MSTDRTGAQVAVDDAPKGEELLFSGGPGAQRVGEPKPVGLERCDESRRARLCWTRALVEYRRQKSGSRGHSRHRN